MDQRTSNDLSLKLFDDFWKACEHNEAMNKVVGGIPANCVQQTATAIAKVIIYIVEIHGNKTDKKILAHLMLLDISDKVKQLIIAVEKAFPAEKDAD